MPYVEHRAFGKPVDEHAKVWRYMDLAKFISLLDSQGVYFTRIDRFQDKFEGAITRPMFGHSYGTTFGDPPPPDSWIDPEEGKKVQISDMAFMRKTSFASCWNQSDYESEALWNLYASRNAGIAIQSTFARLCKSFRDAEDRVLVGTITYMDYELGQFEHSSIYAPLLHKRVSFEHEHEIRAVVWRAPTINARLHPGALEISEANMDEIMNEPIESGFIVPCNLETLVENVYVSPLAGDWFAAVVQSVLDKYGLARTVVHSSLNADPPGAVGS